MKKSAALVLLGFAIFAAAAVASTTRAPSVAVPRAAKAPSKELAPLLAVVPGVRGPVLGRADKRAIWIGRHSPRLRIFNQLRAWAFAPDGSALALATQPGNVEGAASIQFVEPRLLKRLGTARLPWGNLWAIAWGADRVNAVVDDVNLTNVVSVDARTHKIVRTTKLDRRVFGVVRAGSRLVFLTGPACGIDTAGLAVVEADGSVRTSMLPQTLAGSDMCGSGEAPDFSNMHQNVPGLAVDDASGRAFVVPASGPVAVVDLSTLGVAYHSLVQPVSLLGRLHDWVEPKAEAKGVNGPARTAQWLGNGIVGVTGGDETATLDKNKQLHASWAPAGLMLIDTNTWGTKLIDRGADSFKVVGAQMLVTGGRWTDSAQSGMGFAAYQLGGARQFSVLQGDQAYLELAYRGKAYLATGAMYSRKVVDLATGRMLKDRVAPLAQLLIGDGSN